MARVSDSTAEAVVQQREKAKNNRQRVANIRRLAEHYRTSKKAAFPSDGNQERAVVVARKLLDPVPIKVAALIHLVFKLKLADEVAKRFLHEMLRWTLDLRGEYRFPVKSAETALQKIDQCSTGVLSDSATQEWITRCGALPNLLNGDIFIPLRYNKKGHDRGSYKNKIFQAALYNTAQYKYRKRRAIETTILATAVNVRDRDVVGRHSSYLRQLRLG